MYSHHYGTLYILRSRLCSLCSLSTLYSLLSTLYSLLSVQRALEGVDCMIHIAALVGPFFPTAAYRKVRLQRRAKAKANRYKSKRRAREEQEKSKRREREGQEKGKRRAREGQEKGKRSEQPEKRPAREANSCPLPGLKCVPASKRSEQLPFVRLEGRCTTASAASPRTGRRAHPGCSAGARRASGTSRKRTHRALPRGARV